MAYYILSEKQIILNQDNSLPEETLFQQIKASNPLSTYFEEPANSLKILQISKLEFLPPNTKTVPLREYFHTHTTEENFKAFRSKAIASWQEEYRFCPECGCQLKDHDILTAKVCPHCNKIIFPRISPCIIVLVEKDGKILLANHTRRNQDIYACLAGYIEAGESAEDAVRREVFEETNLKIKNIVYRGSQSWPFPDQLMLGYTAEWESGEIKIQEDEIADARWFDRDNCPASPKPGSIAYNLIHRLY